MTLHFSVLCSSGVGDIILGAGLVAKVVLLILTGLSAISWAIAITKIKAFRRSEEQTRRFLATLPRDFSIFEAGRHGRGFGASNLPHLLLEAATSVEKDLATVKNAKAVNPKMIAESARKAMERKAMERLDSMEANLIVLATTASVSPFLGLFGTVWGIMKSFLGMGQVGSASLAVVGSGVAEALITTVFGLGAAIPAVVAYNYLVNRTRKEGSRMESFVSRVTENVEKEIVRELDSSKVAV